MTKVHRKQRAVLVILGHHDHYSLLITQLLNFVNKPLRTLTIELFGTAENVKYLKLICTKAWKDGE